MTSSDVVLCASSYSPFSRSDWEALAMGRPLIAASVGGLPGAIRDGATGILVPAGDRPAMTSAVLRLLYDGESARRLAASQEFVGERSPIEVPASALAHLSREVFACR
jgi:glycosyltransferase involved in cell wall biosynthesis